MESIIVALITGLCSIFGVYLLNCKQLAVISEKINQLEQKVMVHNSIVERMAKAEVEIKHLEEEVDFLEKN